MNRKISLFSLVLLIVAAIDSIRNLPTTAIFGSSLIFFFLFLAILFLIPISFVAAEFASRFPDRGGVFYWVQHAMGEKMGVLAIWLQWINTMVWYPTILFFIAGTTAYLIDPQLAQDKDFLIYLILAVFWGLTLVNLRGVHISARINSFCGLVGLLIPMCFLILLGFLWVGSERPTTITLNWQSIVPSLGQSHNWIALIAIMSSFVGMELAGVHVSDIESAQKNFPKALSLSVLILLLTMILGSLSIAIVIPKDEIRLVDGIMQTFSLFLDAFSISWLTPVLTILIVIGSIGGMINWLISPAKGLLQAAEHGYLPAFFAKKNRYHVPARLLLFQAMLVSLFCLCLRWAPTINSYYWVLTDLSTELYMFMYILLFVSALKLGRPKEAFSYKIPMGMRRISCILGLSGCALTIVMGYFAPVGIGVKMRSADYALLIAMGNVILIAPVLLLWQIKRSGRR